MNDNIPAMKTPFTLLLVAAISILCLVNTTLYAQSRSITAVNTAWKFKSGDDPNASKPLFDDSSWGSISLPHTWNNIDGQDGGSNYFRGTGWYRKSIHLGSPMEVPATGIPIWSPITVILAGIIMMCQKLRLFLTACIVLSRQMPSD